MLEEESELTVKRVAEQLGRSVSATSRLLDQLVVRGLVSRREDERDRRAKRVAITEQGRAFIVMVEQRRADAQLAVMEYLSAEEQAEVIKAMVLLAEAGSRRKQHEPSETGTRAR
jgi:DNA-binding MarR family transcriptional regulator